MGPGWYRTERLNMRHLFVSKNVGNIVKIAFLAYALRTISRIEFTK
jgi:hypothetical protein